MTTNHLTEALQEVNLDSPAAAPASPSLSDHEPVSVPIPDPDPDPLPSSPRWEGDTNVISSYAVNEQLEEAEYPGQASDERPPTPPHVEVGVPEEVVPEEVNAQHPHDESKGKRDDTLPVPETRFVEESLSHEVDEQAETPSEPQDDPSSPPSESPSLDDTASTAPTTEPSTSTNKLPSTESPSIPPESPLSPSIGSPTIGSPSKKAVARGASVLQKTVSMTRQRDLPPKGKDEEKKHLRELEEMRTASKDVEKRRQAQAEARAHARALVLAAVLPTWETAILPNWHAVLHPTPEGIRLRKLWWDGTMPVRWRGRLASLTIGNGLAISKGTFGHTLTRAKKWIEEGRFPEAMRQDILVDVEETLPLLKLFHKDGGVMHDDLVDLLLAYAAYETRPAYTRGVTYPAAMLLLNLPPAEAFISLINLVKKSCLKSFYTQDVEEIDAYHRIFETLLADYMPKVYANFLHEVVRPSLYLNPWLLTLFIRYLPLDLATRIFDVFLLEGDSFLFRVALVMLQVLEPRLFNPDKSELDAVFKGEDKGAVAIVRREKDWDDEMPIEVEEVYTEMGCTETTLFRLLEEQDWKSEMWDRLVSRELPEAD